MKLKNTILAGLLLTAVGLSMNTGHAKADKSISNATYSIAPVYSEHQTDSSLGNFDIKWTPGKTDTIGVEIANNMNQDETFNISMNKAITNSNGVVIYNSDSQNSKAEKPSVKDLVNFPEKVVVKANSKETVYANISFPNNDFNGIKMGGVQVSQQESASLKESGAISQKYEFALPIVLRGNIDKRPTPKITFHKFNIKNEGASNVNLKTPFTNVKANFLKNVVLTTTLTDDNGKQVFKKTKKEIILTPETLINYSTSINKELAGGDYKAKLVIKHASDTWTDTQSIHVSEKKSKSIKKNITENKKTDNKQTWLLVGMGAIIVLFGGIIVFLLKNKKTDNK